MNLEVSNPSKIAEKKTALIYGDGEKFQAEAISMESFSAEIRPERANAKPASTHEFDPS